eukprot:2084284-Ditylum_brightwellii.AAC.1
MVTVLENDNEDNTSILGSAKTDYGSSSVSSSSTWRITIDDDGGSNGGSGPNRSILSGGEEWP